MATKKIELIFDLDAKDVQLATDKTLSLTQQIRVLKQELAKGQLGQKEFEIVAAKVGDLEDNIKKASRRSADFATTLQLIPGPIGEIASKVNGAIALLKQFSGFSFKDLQFQLKETGNDLKEIFMNLGSWGEKTKEVNDVQEELNDTTAASTSLNASAGQAILQTANANQQSINILKGKVQAEKDYRFALESTIKNEEAKREGLDSTDEQYIKSTQKIKNYNRELLESDKYLERYQSELKTLTKTQDSNATAATKDAAAQGEVAVASETATVSTKTQSSATTALTVAQNAASASARILKGVLASLGIGLIIAGVTLLATKLYDLVTSTKDADRANEKFGETLKQLNRILEDNIALVDEETQVQKIRAQMAGKGEKDLTDITIAGIDKRIQVFREGQIKLNREAEKLDALGLTDEQKKTRAKELDEQYEAIEGKVKNLESTRRLEVVKGEAAIASETKKIREKNNTDSQKAASDKLAKDKANLDALIQLEIDKNETDKKVLEKLLEDRFKLELKGQKKSDAEKELARKENTKKVKAALDEDLQLKIRSISATIDEEQNSAVVSVDRLKALLLNKKNLEIQNTQLTIEERRALEVKYEKDIRDIDTKQRQDKLVKDIAATRGNFDEQIRLLTEFQNEVVNSTQYNGEEQLRVINDTNEKILQLQGERFQAQLTATELEYGQLYAFDTKYYDDTRALYDAEEQRYKDLLANKKISQAEFDAFMKQSNQARIDLDQKELDAKMANFQAVSQLFAASAALVGEQTKAGKAFAIASATIDTYVAANQALKEPGVPKIIAAITAAGIIIKGLTNVKRIVEVPLPTLGGGTEGSGSQTTKPMGTINVNAQRKAQGGMVRGAGTETSDSIPAMLSNGEYVVNARSTRLFQPLLAAINDYGLSTPAFAAGGLAVQQASAPSMDNTERIAEAISLGISNQPIRTYVTSSDVTNQQQFDRVIKSRSLI